MGRKLTDAQRVLRYVLTADVAEVRQTLDLVKVVLEVRDGIGVDRFGKTARVLPSHRKAKVTIPPNEPEA